MLQRYNFILIIQKKKKKNKGKRLEANPFI